MPLTRRDDQPDDPNRRAWLLRSLYALPAFSLTMGLGLPSMASTLEPLVVDEATWREWLSPEAFDVLRKEATERAFTSPLDKEYGPGTYVCAGCYLPLFASEHKYNSGTGWPSFWRPINDDHINTKKDFKLIWPRTEYHCARCKGHQGHVFNDGPEPTGQRWCNNGVALRFIPEGEPLPVLRQAPQ